MDPKQTITLKADAALAEDKVIEITKPAVIFSGTIRDVDAKIAEVDSAIYYAGTDLDRLTGEYNRNKEPLEAKIASLQAQKAEYEALRATVATETGFTAYAPIEEEIIPE